MSVRSEQVGLFAAFLAAGVEYAVVGGVAGLIEGKRQVGRSIDVADVERLELVVDRGDLQLPDVP